MIAFCRFIIDHAALATNYSVLARRVAPARVAATLKADAYGLGVHPVARTLAEQGCKDFFVATPHEGWTVRQVVPVEARVYVFSGVQFDTVDDVCAHHLIPVLNSEDEAILWAATAVRRGQRLPAMLHVDTGMMRLGIPDATFAAACRDGLMNVLQSLQIVGLMSHLACAASSEHSFNEDQRRRFDAIRALFPNVMACLGNSAGLHIGASFHYDMVRPGISLYGVEPAHDGEAHGLSMIGRLQARVLQIKDVATGEGIGYGQTFFAKTPMRIAILGMGYADGFPRRLSNKATVWFDHLPAPVVGRVSMDMMAVDVTHVPENKFHQLPNEAAWATVFETPAHVAELARLAGTVEHDILTGLGARVERVHINTHV